MGKIRCQKCGMMAAIPDDINAGGSYLSDSAICPTSGMVIRCARCGNILVGPSQTSTTSTTVTTTVPQGSVQCPKCGTIFKAGTTSPPAQHTAFAIICQNCHRPAPKPKISRSILDSPCGTIKINCNACHTIIFEGTPQAALDRGYVELAS
jgi:ribosomal protein S27E